MTPFTGLSVGLTACGQRGWSSHVLDAGVGTLRCLTALGSPRLTWWMGAAARRRRAGWRTGRLCFKLGQTSTEALMEMRLWACERWGRPAGGRGRLWAAGPPWVGCEGRDRGRRRFLVCSGTVDGIRHRMEHYRGQCCNGASGRRCGRVPVTARSPRRPGLDVMRALVVAGRGGKVISGGCQDERVPRHHLGR